MNEGDAMIQNEKPCILAINCNLNSGGGKMMMKLAQVARAEGMEYYTVSPGGKWNIDVENHFYITTRLQKALNRELYKFHGLDYFLPFSQTGKLIRIIDRIKPDIIHFHGLHGWYVDYIKLCSHIAEKGIPVVWTQHDCWAFTGKCPYFDAVSCEKWRDECDACPQCRSYPGSFTDRTSTMWKKKKEAFLCLPKLTVVTPSNWLAELVKQSFLNKRETVVINNGIDLSNFRPMKSDFRERYQCTDKYIILGVANLFSERKGLGTFIELSRRLDTVFQIVLVGTNSEIDRELPENIISIHNTQNVRELAEIYSASDLFVNPTVGENFPTVNIEALACGTPVLTYKTGGSPEIADETCGSVVPCGDIDSLEKEIRRIYAQRPYTVSQCVERAKRFDAKNKFGEYVKLYRRILNNE